MEIHSSDLRKYSYFSSLSGSAVESLAQRIETVDFPAGTVIVEEGTIGDSFYFVKEGQLEVSKKSKSGQDAKLSVIGSGQGFGDMALLTCSVRSSSVHAITDVTLLRLSKKDFDDIILHDSAFRERLQKRAEDYSHLNSIKTLQPFQLLEPEKMCALIEKMTEKTFAPGENIIVQGEKGDNYYIIKSGSVSVLKKNKDGEGHQRIALLSEGEAFGEEALIRDDPRNATCRAEQQTTVLVLSKSDFSTIVKTSFLDNIFPEDITLDTYLDEYVIIDARIPAEYEEEHIYGAINIPVERLRGECTGFDRSKKYITYCLNDSRGMVAAFLLKNRGFDAQCLRGGVSGWEGRLVTGSTGVHLPEG
ncbi:MAG: cyclic nucleotide-binding domain-containing protein [Nitrospirae bacterium]|nr:cyclic nucleotide-binding domain-containing protein [Nitrospirota bacterium]